MKILVSWKWGGIPDSTIVDGYEDVLDLIHEYWEMARYEWQNIMPHFIIERVEENGEVTKLGYCWGFKNPMFFWLMEGPKRIATKYYGKETGYYES